MRLTTISSTASNTGRAVVSQRRPHRRYLEAAIVDGLHETLHRLRGIQLCQLLVKSNSFDIAPLAAGKDVVRDLDCLLLLSR